MAVKLLIVRDNEKRLGKILNAFPKGEFKIIRTAPFDLDHFLRRECPEVAIVCLKNLKEELKALSVIKFYDDNMPAIITSPSDAVEHVVSAMREGAYDYFPYPFSKIRLKNSVLNAAKLYRLTKRVFLLESITGMQSKFDDMIGSSGVMGDVFNTIKMVSKSNATILIQGESGTGKELAAKAIHRHSLRAHKIFLDINCGAIPKGLLENEMFGHEKGAFTGADEKYTGSCERADGGTIFLDEVSEMDEVLQVKLLRFLQERTFTRVGGSEPVSVDVRIIASTNRDLEKLVREKKFREDLFYRLNVVPLRLPPLREKKEDIPLLAKYFLSKFSAKNEKIFLDFAPEVIEAFLSHDWPGNVRELQNVIERIVVLNNDTRVKLKYLEKTMRSLTGKARQISYLPPSDEIVTLEVTERCAIESAIKRCAGNIPETARKLHVGAATLYRKIKRYGIAV